MRAQANARRILAIVLAGALCAAADAAERVYKWTDKDGVVHYGQQPPTETKSEAIKVQKGYSAPATDEPAQPTPAAQRSATQDEYCANATKSADMLTSPDVVTRKDDAGVVHVLTPEEREAELRKAKAAMELYCEPAAKPK